MLKILTETIGNPKQKWRLIVTLGSIPLAIVVYLIFQSWIYPDGWDYKSVFGKDVINIYSGSENGIYFTLGKTLADCSGGLNLQNKKTKGSRDNLRKVRRDQNGVGFVQEEFINPEWRSDLINVATPLYMERLHILYRIDDKDSFIVNIDGPLVFDLHTNSEILKYLDGKRIGTGPIGSGTREMTSYLLSELNIQAMDQVGKYPDYKVVSIATLPSGLDSLFAKEPNNRIDFYFFVSGSPVKSVNCFLNEKLGRVGMVSVTASLVTQIANRTGIDYHVSDFGDHYSLENNVSTIATQAMLIAHPRINSSQIDALLSRLSDNEFLDQFSVNNNNVRDTCQYGATSSPDLTDELRNAYKPEPAQVIIQSAKNLGFFLITFITSIVALVNFFIWMLSIWKQQRYFRRIYLITSSVFSMRIKVSETKGILKEELNSKRSFFQLELGFRFKRYVTRAIDELDELAYFVTPQVEDNSNHVINKTVWAIVELFHLSNKLHLDYQTGGLTDQHYAFISNFIQKARASLRKLLNQELIKRVDSGDPMPMYTVSDYHHKGLITHDDYRYLRLRMEEG